MTPVKDQKQCGSCWAFSATEQIETDIALATGKLLTLSPQQITSCTTSTVRGVVGGSSDEASSTSFALSAGALASMDRRDAWAVV